MTRRLSAAVSAAAILSLHAAGAQAGSLSDWLSQPTMTGDWGGARTKLESIGIMPRADYVGEFADVLSGGKQRNSDYAQQFRFGFDADLQKLANWNGAHFHFTMNARSGRNASADDIGNKLGVQEVYGAGENTRLSEVSIDQYLDGKFINAKVGFYAMGNDFGVTPMLCDFQNTAFCAHPQNLPNDSGWSDYPTAKWGGRVLFNLRPDLYLETGAFDVNPTYTQPSNGMKINLGGSTGVLLPVELGYTSAFGAARMPGHYKIGAYYDSSQSKDVGESTTVTRSGRYGGYILVDQMVWSFEPGTARGLVLFAQGSMSDTATSPISTYAVAAAIAQGPFAARPKDFIDFGYVRAGVNHRTIDLEESKGLTDLSQAESVYEGGYGIQITPWMLLHPNVQYVQDPGAFSFKHIPDAWVFGLQTKLTL